jgi:hypothetical protein
MAIMKKKLLFFTSLSLILPSLMLSCSWPKQKVNDSRIVALDEKRELFLTSLNFKNAIESTPKFYRLQIASTEEWRDSFQSFKKKYKLLSYIKMVEVLGEENVFWCLDKQIISAQEAHLAIFQDIKKEDIKNLKDLFKIIPESHITKLHQSDAINSTDLHFLFRNFIIEFPKSDLGNWKDIFTWETLRHLYYLGAIDKEDFSDAFTKSLEKHQSVNLHEILAVFPFEQIKFLHEERMVSTSRLQKAFYMVESEEEKSSFDLWVKRYGHKNLSYMISKSIIPAYSVNRSFENSMNNSMNFSTLIKDYRIPLISLMVRMKIISIEKLKTLFKQEIKNSNYESIATLFKDVLNEYDISWLERKKVLSIDFWQEFELGQKLKEEFKNYNFVVLREKIFPLPSYFEKNLTHFPLLKELSSMEKEYISLRQHYQSRQDLILRNFNDEQTAALNQKQKELTVLEKASSEANQNSRDPYSNKIKKDEISSRYDYLMQRVELSKDNKMVEAEKLFEDKVYEATKTWKTL